MAKSVTFLLYIIVLLNGVILNWFDDGKDSKRTLGIRDKQILYRNAKDRCQNPGCGKKIRFDEMQVGHKKASSKNGKTSLANCVCLCYSCNKLQGTDSWATFLKKQGVKDKTTILKEKLETLNISQLKSLAEKHHIKVKGKVEENLFNTYRKVPTKKQYISKLARIVSEKEITTIAEKKATTTKKAGSNKKPTNKSITKKQILNQLPKTKLKKIVNKLDLDYDGFWDGDEKEDYVKFLSSSRKVTVKKIEEII